MYRDQNAYSWLDCTWLALFYLPAGLSFACVNLDLPATSIPFKYIDVLFIIIHLQRCQPHSILDYTSEDQRVNKVLGGMPRRPGFIYLNEHYIYYYILCNSKNYLSLWPPLTVRPFPWRTASPIFNQRRSIEFSLLSSQ